MPEVQARSLDYRRRVSAKTVNRRVTAVLRDGFRRGKRVRDNRGGTVPSGVSARITDAIRGRLTYACQRANVSHSIVAHRDRFKFWVGVNAVPIRGTRIETAPASWIGGPRPLSSRMNDIGDASVKRRRVSPGEKSSVEKNA